jgi:electron transport complex protein RnfB
LDWSLVWKAAIALGALSLLFGVMLAFAAEKFKVDSDPRLDELLEAVLGTNCGACGYPGCEAACNAVLEGKAGVDVCIAGGKAAVEAVARVMGVEPQQRERGVALVHCRGGINESAPRANYQGIDSCAAAELIARGGKACAYGCLGRGTCKAVCPVNAITLDEDHIRKVNREKCTGCALCVESCPRHLLQIVPRSQEVLVVCNNREKGAKAKKNCTVCCIACKKCEKACDFGAIYVDQNRAWIDYEKCTQCGKCIEACPTKCLVRVRPHKTLRKKAAASA